MTDKNTGGYEGVSRSFNVCGEVVPRERGKWWWHRSTFPWVVDFFLLIGDFTETRSKVSEVTKGGNALWLIVCAKKILNLDMTLVGCPSEVSSYGLSGRTVWIQTNCQGGGSFLLADELSWLAASYWSLKSLEIRCGLCFEGLSLGFPYLTGLATMTMLLCSSHIGILYSFGPQKRYVCQGGILWGYRQRRGAYRLVVIDRDLICWLRTCCSFEGRFTKSRE